MKTSESVRMTMTCSLLPCCVFVDNGEWHGIESYSIEDRHNSNLDRSNAKKLVSFVLKYCDEGVFNVVKEYHRALFDEPWAFGSLYPAVRDNPYENVRREAMCLLGPAAKTILEKYEKNMSVSWTPDRRVRELVEAALDYNKVINTDMTF